MQTESKIDVRIPAHAQYTGRDGASETRDQTHAAESDTWRTNTNIPLYYAYISVISQTD